MQQLYGSEHLSMPCSPSVAELGICMAAGERNCCCRRRPGCDREHIPGQPLTRTMQKANDGPNDASMPEPC